MADDPVATALAEIRAALIPVTTASSMPGAFDGQAALRALAALAEVLKPHAPRSDVLYGVSCSRHRFALNDLRPVEGCPDCTQDERRDVCPECRDEFGDPVPFGDCRARNTVLTVLTGKESSSG